MKSEVIKEGGTMKNNNFLIYGSYLGILGIIILLMQVFGLSAKIGLWTALAVAAIYAIFWPRW